MKNALDSVFFVDRSDRARLRVTGPDRQSFLQGMVSNEVLALEPGQGCYAFLLDRVAHVLADVRLLCLPDALLLDGEPGRAGFIAEWLDRYLIREQCRVEDVTEATAQVFVGGREAPVLLESFGVRGGETWTEGRNQAVILADADATIAATRLIPGPGFDLYLPAGVRADALAALRAAGAAERTGAALEGHRIEAGVPRGGVDFDETVLAPETAQQDRALSHAKGCYIGQEIVARIEARGHTNRVLTGFRLIGETLPATGAVIEAEGKAVGRVTSSVWSATLDTGIALGYLRNEYAAPGAAVVIAGQPATVAALPFIP